MAMSEEAKAMVQDSIRIIREDRFERFVRNRVAKDDKEAPKGNPKGTPEPPPKSENEPPPPPKSLWWGDMFTEQTK